MTEGEPIDMGFLSLPAAAQDAIAASTVKRVMAPWSPDQVASLNAFQIAHAGHPYTCSGGGGTHAWELAATPEGWRCLYPGGQCDYHQDWAWEAHTDWRFALGGGRDTFRRIIDRYVERAVTAERHRLAAGLEAEAQNYADGMAAGTENRFASTVLREVAARLRAETT